MTTTPATQAGPRITLKASCFDCPFVQSESYRVQSDSGHDVRCAHPSFDKPKRVGDTVWDTPDFCPVADIPAIRARVSQAHSLPGDVGMRIAELEEALKPFDRQARSIGLSPEQDRYSFAGTGLSNGDLRRASTVLAAALTPSALSGDAGEAMAKRTFLTCVSGDGPQPYLKVHFNNLADAHAAHDELLGRKGKS